MAGGGSRNTLRIRTRRQRSGGGARKGLMTIPQLRKAFDHMHGLAEKLVKQKRGDSQVAEFQREWMKTFGKPVNKAHTVAYLNHVAGIGSNKSQKGGSSSATAPLGGAPLDYSLQPGLYLSQGSLPVAASGSQSGGGAYGNFLQYLAGGFDVGVPARANQMQCGQVDQTPILRAGLGDNTYFAKAGGRRRTLRRSRKQTGGMRWFAATNPSSFARDIADGWQGAGVGPSPSATDPTWTGAKGASTSLNWAATPIPRTLSVDVSAR